MTLKRATFKQRARKNEMKVKQKASSDLRKRMRVGTRRHNRFDDVDTGSRPLDEIVDEIAQGSAMPTREIALDPRSLTDLLLRQDGATSRLALPSAPLAEDDPLALPTLCEEEAFNKKAEGGPLTGNKNQYRHHGDPYLFWERVGLHPLLLQALRSMRFTHPTPVQEEVLPNVLHDTNSGSHSTQSKKSKKRGIRQDRKDVIISAETGSGKTLAFALPILHHVLTTMPLANTTTVSQEASNEMANITKLEDAEERENIPVKNVKKKVKKNSGKIPTEKSGKKRAREEEEDTNTMKYVNKEVSRTSVGVKDISHRIMQALIVSPTRELALQINEAMLQLTQHAPQVVIGCIVGGMAPEKQQRVLNRHPHVLICTPGRLWELVQKNEGCYLGHSISRRLSFVTLDEADKLLQSGRFEELKNLLERIHCEVLPAGYAQEREEGAEINEAKLEAGRWDEATQTFIPFSRSKGDEVSGGEASTNQKTYKKDEPRPIPMPPDPSEDHRVVTFVTSATLSLQTNYERRDLRANKTVIRTSNVDTMGTVLQQLQIKTSNANVFTVSPKADVAAKIQESYLRCPGDSKDLYLYYFLKMYRERTIVFVNAISMLRRLVKLLDVLGIPVAGLHASLQQRQRLKYIDKFRKGEKRVLIATDIASRGLDVEGVNHVIHFQVPRTTDAYIHRCGRTARCGGTGLSLVMVNAQEHTSFKKLMESLGRDVSSMEVFALQPTLVHHLHAHVKIALQIDKLQKEIDKSRAKNSWVRRTSREADIEIDDMVDDEAENENRSKEKAIKMLKKRLELMMKKDMGSAGGKGGFRSSAQALGAKKAESKFVERAMIQTNQVKKKKHKSGTAGKPRQ